MSSLDMLLDHLRPASDRKRDEAEELYARGKAILRTENGRTFYDIQHTGERVFLD